MDNNTRLHYLNAMGIDVWVPRFVHEQNTENVGSTVDDELYQEPDKGDSTWSILQASVAACTQCELCKTRKQTVFGKGNKTADWLIIGEAPGQHEDEQGEPFVGRAGALLTEMLRAVGLERDAVFITNILKCRPPGNRDPKPEEAMQCSGFLKQQIALIKPKIILAVGRISANTLLNSDAPLAKLRGKVYSLDGIPMVVVYHPSYLLRSLSEKSKAWQDLQLAYKTINTKG